jgi:hypothetical protein
MSLHISQYDTSTNDGSSIAQNDGTRRDSSGAREGDKTSALYKTLVAFTYINFKENVYTVRSCIWNHEVDFDEVHWFSDHDSITTGGLTTLQCPHSSCKPRSR